MKLFFSVQLGHLKLSGYGLLSTQGVQNRSQNCWIVSQSEVMLQYMRYPGAPAELGPKGVKDYRKSEVSEEAPLLNVYYFPSSCLLVDLFVCPFPWFRMIGSPLVRLD